MWRGGGSGGPRGTRKLDSLGDIFLPRSSLALVTHSLGLVSEIRPSVKWVGRKPVLEATAGISFLDALLLSCTGYTPL